MILQTSSVQPILLHSSLHFRIFLFLLISLFMPGCRPDANDKNNPGDKKPITDSLQENVLLIGDDTLRLIPVFDSLVCELEVRQDLRWPFRDTGLTGFETEKRDTIRIGNYRDYYDLCGCFILDTLPVVSPGAFITVSKFSGKVSPDELIAQLEKGLVFKSPLGKYSIEAIQFCAYCPSGDCQPPWQASSQSPFNENLKARIRTYFSKDAYLVLYLVIAKDEKGNYVRIHPALCWQGK